MSDLARPPSRPGPFRLAFLGTPAAAVPPLRGLVDAGHEVAVVVSRADKRRRRRGPLEPSPVKAAALELGLPVTDRVDDVLDAGVDLGVVVAFGRLIRRHVLEAVPMVNVHFSLLPRWRGAAPVERAVLAGDEVTGVCVMGLEEGLDTGPVFGRVEVAVGPEETAAGLRDRLVDAGTDLLVRLLAGGLPDPEPQRGEPTYAAKVEPDELRLDWARPAAELHRVVRVGGAWTTFRGARLKVHRATVGPARPELAPGQLDGVVAGTADGTLVLAEVQAEGRPARPAAEWARGARPAPGECLGR